MEPNIRKNIQKWVPVIVKGKGGKKWPHNGVEPDRPAWTLVSDTLNQPEKLFRNSLFLEGCSFSSNIYLIFGESVSIFDPGNNYAAFEQLFESPKFAPQDIRRVILSHGHPAHANATMALFRYPCIRNNPEFEVVLHEAGPTELKQIILNFGARVKEVRGGEILDLEGFDWEVIHTPGHTPDSICLFHSQTGALLSGDTALPGGRAAPSESADGYQDRNPAGLEWFPIRKVVNILPGHGSPARFPGIGKSGMAGDSG